jgi:hypothetical protein
MHATNIQAATKSTSRSSCTRGFIINSSGRHIYLGKSITIIYASRASLLWLHALAKHTRLLFRMDDRGRIYARNAITTCRFALGRRRLLSSSSSSLRTPNLHKVHRSRSSGGEGAAQLETLNMTRRVETKREKAAAFAVTVVDLTTSPSLCYEYLQCKDDPNRAVRPCLV